jgi:hypothetical protein
VLFYLGTHEPSWLRNFGAPLFVSDRRLRRLKSMPRAADRWALDSGGFTELSQYGAWTVPEADYIARTRRYADEVGKLDFAAPQDWMCEPKIREQTGLTVRDHQDRTIRSVLSLRAAAPELPWIPVLQGWTLPDYLRHIDDYARHGIDLRTEPVVGVGTVCRRQSTAEGAQIVRTIAQAGIRVHAFGFKLTGLVRVADVVTSSDSMAWSFAARWDPPLPGCTHISCNNCRKYAASWRQRILQATASAGGAEGAEG